MKSTMLSLLLIITMVPVYSNSGEEEILSQLVMFNIMNGLSDYKSSVEPLVVLLDEGDVEVNTIYMKKNRDYRLAVVCDDDCDDVDVWLYDSDGDLIDSDTDGNDTAILKGRPDESGQYTIKILVDDCDSEPCYVGAQLFER